ncbi:MAG: hypothetical protein A2X18_02455 [Bacteroidetes bacterium GWF2_40_14]|nr:MAG: hypothetical protein A2X18_02455 [Bacteroidetes bacterium GWF2_40_14]
MKTNFILVTIIILSYGCLSAQTNKPATAQIPEKTDSLSFEAEKLYIHTDKDAYVAGDTIWFRAYLTNSSYLSTLPLSNYVYVELCCDTLVSRVKIKCSDKGYSGFIPIKKSVLPGNYTIRGYTKNMQNYPVEFAFTKKTVILNKDKESVNKPITDIYNPGYDIDIQFLPESGRYLQNRPARIAFKAVGSDGKSANIEVVLYTNTDVLVGQYESRHNGMGLINLVSADADGYYAIINGNEGFTKKILLPKPVLSGAVIGVIRIGEKIGIKASVTSDINGAILIIRNSSEELIRKSVTKNLQSGGFEENIIISENSLPDGVNSIQIIGDKGEILAERLFFLNKKFRPEIEISQNKNKFEKRGRVEIEILLKDVSGKPMTGELSIAVTDSSLAPVLSQKDNILSYMELSSEIRGEIEDPGYYFCNPTTESDNFLDLVMMTNGWRVHTTSSGVYKREYDQEISGSISGLFKREPKNTSLMLVAPDIKLQQAYTLEKRNSFLIEGLDFPDSTKFLLGVAGKSGGQLFGLTVNDEKFLPVPPFKKPVYNQKEREILQKSSELLCAILPADQNRNLKPIIVTARREFFQPKYNPSPFLQTFSRSQMKEREDLAEFDDFPLMNYIVQTFPGLMVGTGQFGRILQSTRRGGSMYGPMSYAEPMLYVNGMQINEGTTYLEQFLVQDMENVGFLRGTAGSMFNTLSGVILVSLKRGRSAFNKTPTNIAMFTPLGYQKTVEFYTPKYETIKEKESGRSDIRSTLYWNPCVRTDENGRAKVTFYTGDLISKLNISAEGVTSSGEYVAR